MHERQWYQAGSDGGLLIHSVVRRVRHDPVNGNHQQLTTRCGMWLQRSCGRIGDVNCMTCLVAMTSHARSTR